MTLFVLIQVLYFLICILEAWLEKVVIELKNPKAIEYVKLNRQEHNRSAVYAVFVGLSLIIIANVAKGFDPILLLLLIQLLVIRLLGFDFFLKIFRGRAIKNIEGKGNPVDDFCRKFFGEKGGWWQLLS